MELTPELLAQFRTIGLRLDRTGRFWHQGVMVTHARLALALRRWLDVRDGRDVVALDAERYAYVEVEDAHLQAVAARWDGARCVITWDDEREEELTYASLRVGAGNALYAAVRGVLRGRIAGPAYHAVAERIVEEGDGFAIEAAGRRWRIAGAG
jgi:hypothetical protein